MEESMTTMHGAPSARQRRETMSNTFHATHEIHSDNSVTPVMLRDGCLYTREEWDTCTAADWELVGGLLLFHGHTLHGYGLRAVPAGEVL